MIDEEPVGESVFPELSYPIVPKNKVFHGGIKKSPWGRSHDERTGERGKKRKVKTVLERERNEQRLKLAKSGQTGFP